jgi:hypothetical protein
MLDPLDITCYHEAGHAVFNATCGYRLWSIEIYFTGNPTHPFNGRTETSGPEDPWGVRDKKDQTFFDPCQDYLENLRRSLAGTVAEVMCQTSAGWDAASIVQQAISPEFNMDNGEVRQDFEDALTFFSCCGQGSDRDEVFAAAAQEVFQVLSQEVHWNLLSAIQQVVREPYDRDARLPSGPGYAMDITQFPQEVQDQLRTVSGYQ